MSQSESRIVKRIRASGGISVTVWCRDETSADGHSVPRYTFEVQKRYRTKSGEWAGQEMSLFLNEIPLVRLALDKAFEFVSLKSDGENQAAA